jgi:pimeloyl-[acyl-carrier protein] methyl ester esterase
MVCREHHLADGRVLAWQETGSGPPLVLLHGWSLSGHAFSELAGQLGDFRLLLPDLPGHGGSSPPAVVSLPALATDVAAWLESEVKEPVALGGWSLGGMVALELAARQDAPLSQLVLIGTSPRFTISADWPHGLPAGQVLALRRNLRQAFAATLAGFFDLTFAPDEVDAARLREIRAFAVRAAGLPDPAAAAALLALLAEQDQRHLLPAIRCPALVLHGTCDRVTPVGAGRALAAALPRGELRELPGLGHAPFWTQPAAVSGAIREFCAWGR